MPASYPTAVKTFTTKGPGDIVLPAFVNDLQDEVHALSSALIGGTERLVSSNSTLAALSVPGGSTLASLQVSSNCTIAGTLTVNKIVSTSVGGRSLTSYVWAYCDTTAKIPAVSTNSTYKLRLNTKLADLASEWDTATYTFTPKSSGFYRVEAAYRNVGVNIGQMYMSMTVNDTVYAQARRNSWAGQPSVVMVAATVRLSSGTAGQVAFRVFADGESSVVAGSLATWATITRLW